MNNSTLEPPVGGAEDEISANLDKNNVTKESIITQINQIYNTISNKDSFRIIRQYCRGIKPNVLLQTLIKLVSSLQEGLMFYQSDQESQPYFKPIEDFISSISFDNKIQNVILFCSRIELGISYLVSNEKSIKNGTIASKITTCYTALLGSCNELNANNLSIQKITTAINALESLRESINNYISASSTAVSTRARPSKKNIDEDESGPNNNLTNREILDTYASHESSFFLTPGPIKTQYWTKQAQNYSENVEKILHQLLYMFALKDEFKALSNSLHVFQNIIDETNSFPEDNQISTQNAKRIRRKKRKNENEDQIESNFEQSEKDDQSKSPFVKRQLETDEIKEIASYAKWAEVNQSNEKRIDQPLDQPQEKKRKKKHRSSNKSKKSENDDNDDNLEEIAHILPAKSTSQRHMRPYETINALEMENKKLEDLIRQCPHKPEEVKQLREENAALSQKVKELAQELDELQSMLYDEQDKIYESD